MRNKKESKNINILKKETILVLFIVCFIFFSISLVSAFSGSGTGTLADPYVIGNCTQLAEMNDSRTANYSLSGNIDCSDTINWNSGAGWSPISPTYASRFIGTLDGKDYDITGLYANRTTNNIGLFGYADTPGNITNFDLTGVNIKGGTYVGGIISYNYGAKIDQVSVQGNISGAADIAGFVGVNSAGTISRSYFSGNVTGTGSMIGGIVGDSGGTSSIIQLSYSEGTISGNGVVGGVIARNYGAISNSYSIANVSDTSISLGGFVGSTVSGSSITNSYSAGKVSGSNPTYSHGFGEVGGTFTADYWDSETSGISTTGSYGKGTPKTTAQMKNVSTYTTSSAWDFVDNPNNDVANNDYWNIDSNVNNGYPALVGVGVGEAFLTPTVTLNNPTDNYYFAEDPASVTFNCSVTATNTLSNISLYITDNTNSSFALNQTTVITGTSNETTWDLDIAQGNYTWNCLAYDNTNRLDWGANQSIFGDTTPPSFTTFANQSISVGDALGYDIDATDTGSGISCFTVNDTTNFAMNCSGYLQNNTVLSQQIYWLNITVNDSVNNLNSGVMFVNVTPVPSIGLSLIYPTGNININQSSWFNVTVNVSCNGADCGAINVSLDPASNLVTNGDFETGDITGWTTGGNANWAAQGTTKYEGSYAGKAGTITHSQNTWITQNVTLTSNGTLDFWWKVSSETSFDYLGFCINKNFGVSGCTRGTGNITAISGTIDWQKKSVNLSVGTYQLLWYYAKDGSVNTGSDTGWVDNVTILGASTTKSGLVSTTSGDTPFYTNVTNPYNLTLNNGQSQIITWWINATGTINTNHTFFVYANQTADMTINNITSTWNVSITNGTSPPVPDTTPPLISFDSLTPTNGTSTSNTSVEINVSIIESDLNEVKYNWNGTNFTIYDNNLLFMYNFDNRSTLGENDTLAVDLSSYSNNGSVVGGAQWISNGKYDGAYQFDGSDDSITTSLPTTKVNNITFSFWTNISASSDTRGGLLFSGTLSNGYGLFAGSSDCGTTTNFCFLAQLKYWHNTGIGWTAGKWHHIVVSLEPSGSSTVWKLYKDGVLTYTSSALANPATPTTSLNIGSEVASNSIPNTMDDVKFWNKTLTASEVYQEYTSNLQKFNSTQWYLYVNQSQNASDGLSDGSYTYFASAKDSTGNENLTETRTITIDTSPDTTPPAISIVYPLNNTNSSNNRLNINYTVSDLSLDSCWYSNDTMSVNTTLTGCTNITTVTWNEGQHNVTIWSNDSSNNLNSSSVTFNIDTISPIWFNNLTNITSTTTSGESVYFNVTFNDTNPDKYIFSWYNGSTWTNDSSVSYINNQEISVTKTIPSDGQINWTWYVNDTFGNTNQTDIWSIIINTTDSDGDGFPDSSDKLLFNETNVSHSGLTRLNITIGGNATNGIFSGVQEVLFYDESTLMINFSHNLSASSLDLSKVNIIKTSTSLIVNLSGQLSGYNKTLYIADDNFASLCVKDAEIGSIGEVSSGCNGVNETDFTNCLGGDLSSNGIDCTDQGSTIKIDNLKHSAIRGTQASSSPSPGGSSGGGGGGSSKKKVKNETKLIKYECTNNNECRGDKSCFNHQCVKLFDIKLLEIDSPVNKEGELYFKYFLKGMANFNNDVVINFWLEGKKDNNKIISSGQDTIYLGSFEEKTERTKIYIPSNLSKGSYEFYIKVSYENYEALSHRTIYVEQGEEMKVSLRRPSPITKPYVYWPLIIILIFILLNLTLHYLHWETGRRFVWLDRLLTGKKHKRKKVINKIKKQYDDKDSYEGKSEEDVVLIEGLIKATMRDKKSKDKDVEV